MKINIKVCFLILFITVSCQPRFTNEFGDSIPKNPNFKLKNAITDPLPPMLDTTNIYRYIGYYNNNGKLIIDDISSNWKLYKKFGAKNRLYYFGARTLNEVNLAKIYASEQYYIYNANSNLIITENFVDNPNLYNKYLKLKYKINEDGDTLIGFDKGRRDFIYVKEILPNNLKHKLK